MIDAAARAVAYVAGRLTSGRDAPGLVDRVSGAGSSFTGDVDPARVSVYDRTLDCWVVGRSHDGGPLWLFHQETMRYLTLVAERPGLFTGTDWSTHHTFDVLVAVEGNIEVLDHQTGRWRRYRLEQPQALAV